MMMVLLTPTLLWSAEEPAERRRRTSTQTDERQAPIRRVQAAKPDIASVSGGDMKIFALRYQQAGKLAEIIETLIPPNEVTIAVDDRSQNLVVASSPDQMQQITHLIAALDAPPPGEAHVPQMLYRIYMLELPPEHENLRPFAMELEGTGQITSAQLLGIAQEAGIRIDSLSQEPHDETWQKWELMIEGRAAEDGAVTRMLENIPESRMKELQWDDETVAPPPTQVAKLPAELGKHVQQLLGGNVQTVGYWFGNLSVPGKARAPIGPWSFEMSVERQTQDSQVELEISVTHLLPSGEIWEILGNSVRSHITKPVIIGYNRETHGTRTMGALVIVPQESPDL
jgi:hypothetical protein